MWVWGAILEDLYRIRFLYVWKIGGGWFTSSKVWGIQIDKRKKKCIIYNNKMTAVVYTSMRVMFQVHE